MHLVPLPGSHFRIVARAILFSAVALAPLEAVLAQSAPDAPAAQASFSIPAQPLADALRDFTRQSGLQVGFDDADVAGRQSAAVSGSLSAAEALSRLLQGSGLSYRFTAATAVRLEPAPQAADGVTQLGMLRVQGGDGRASNGAGGGDTGGPDGRGLSAADRPFATPGSSSHISREALDRVPAISMGDIFKNTPGVISNGNRSGLGLNLNIRGLQGMGRINTLVDGTQQTGSQYIGYRGQPSSVFIDPDLIGGVDISKGPNDGPQGIGAIGGVVNMRTLEAGDIVPDGSTYGARVRAGFSDNAAGPITGSKVMRTDAPSFFNGGSYTGSIAVATNTDHYDLIAVASRRKLGNYFAGTKGSETYVDQMGAAGSYSPYRRGVEVFNSSEDTTSILLKGKLRFGNGHSLELGYSLYDSRRGVVADAELLYTGFLGFNQYAPAVAKTNTYTARYAWKPSEDGLIDLHANLWKTDLTTIQYTYGTDHLEVGTWGAELYNRSVIGIGGASLALNYGGQIVHEKDEMVASNSGSYGPDGTRMLSGLYARADLALTSWLNLGGSLRYDHYSVKPGDFGGHPPADIVFKDSSGSRLNPAASITVTPLRGVQFFANYSEGFRPLTLREATFTFGLGSTIQPNPDLKPEIARTWEAGVNVLRSDLLRSGDKLTLKATYFHNDYQDYIYRFRETFGFPYRWVNMDRAKFQGIEVNAGYDMRLVFVEAGLTHYTRVAFCPAGVCTGVSAGTDYGSNYVPPETTINATLGARLFKERLTFGGRLRYVTARAGDGYTSVYIPATAWPESTIVDLFGSFKITKRVEATVSAENIGDRYYVDPLATSNIPSPGRTVRLGISINL